MRFYLVLAVVLQVRPLAPNIVWSTLPWSVRCTGGSSAAKEHTVLADGVGGVARSAGDQNMFADGVGGVSRTAGDQKVLLAGNVASGIGLMCSVDQEVAVAGTSKFSIVHAPDVFGDVIGVLNESEANWVGNEKAEKMAVFEKPVNDYEWYDRESGDIGKSWGNASKGECWNLKFVLAIPTGLKGVPT